MTKGPRERLTLEDYIQKARCAETGSELFSLYEKFMEGYGFDRVAYLVLNKRHELHNHHPLGLVAMNSLNGWEDYYLENNCIDVDAMAIEAYASAGVYNWNHFSSSRKLSVQQLNIFKASEQEAGLFHGTTFSVHGPNSSKAVVMACSSQKNLKVEPTFHDFANLAAHQYHSCYLSINKLDTVKPKKLSEREHDVLRWAATGLTKTQIAERLNLSSHTVDYHMRNVLVKLNAKNTTAALATAIREGLII